MKEIIYIMLFWAQITLFNEKKQIKVNTKKTKFMIFLLKLKKKNYVNKKSGTKNRNMT